MFSADHGPTQGAEEISETTASVDAFQPSIVLLDYLTVGLRLIALCDSLWQQCFTATLGRSDDDFQALFRIAQASVADPKHICLHSHCVEARYKLFSFVVQVMKASHHIDPACKVACLFRSTVTDRRRRCCVRSCSAVHCRPLPHRPSGRPSSTWKWLGSVCDLSLSTALAGSTCADSLLDRGLG